jgi:urease accessory protein
MSVLGAGAASRVPLLRLLQLASPALPVGAYAYSRGLESAVSFGWVRDEQEAFAWIAGVVENSVACLESPVMCRLHASFLRADSERAEYWNQFLCAARESQELALEDRQLGWSLARVLVDQGVPEAELWRGRGAYATLFALACARWAIPLRDALSAYLFAFAENQVSCAIKLVPLGQSAGQRILARLIPRVDDWVQAAANMADDEIGSYTPRLALASALHETQYTRLFRS